MHVSECVCVCVCLGYADERAGMFHENRDACHIAG